ncbi:hypothetical protein HDU96_009747 [Phlyctochytrium bullatum]|nr:hypothetical protein HDU96_009747 [Phlyctochytrium bullatum]
MATASSITRGGSATDPLLLIGLPEEVIIQILQHCRPTDLCTLSKSCKRMAALASLDAIWKPIAAVMYQPASAAEAAAARQLTWEEHFDEVMGSSTTLLNHPTSPIDDGVSLPVPSSGATTTPLPLPLLNFKPFLATLSLTRCFRCGIDARDRAVIGSVGLEALDVFKRRYCKQCQKRELVTRAEARERWLVSEKQLAQLRCVAKPWYNKTCLLYLRSQVEDLAILKWGSSRLLAAERERRRTLKPLDDDIPPLSPDSPTSAFPTPPLDTEASAAAWSPTRRASVSSNSTAASPTDAWGPPSPMPGPRAATRDEDEDDDVDEDEDRVEGFAEPLFFIGPSAVGVASAAPQQRYDPPAGRPRRTWSSSSSEGTAAMEVDCGEGDGDGAEDADGEGVVGVPSSVFADLRKVRPRKSVEAVREDGGEGRDEETEGTEVSAGAGGRRGSWVTSFFHRGGGGVGTGGRWST